MDCFNLFSTLYWQTFQKGLEQISGELAEPTQAIRGHKGICICICICICVYICICISIFILYVFLYNCFKKFQQEARADIRRVSEAKTSNQRTKSCLHLSLYLYLYLCIVICICMCISTEPSFEKRLEQSSRELVKPTQAIEGHKGICICLCICCCVLLFVFVCVFQLNQDFKRKKTWADLQRVSEADTSYQRTQRDLWQGWPLSQKGRPRWEKC